MNRVDMHVHSRFSFDGKSDMLEECKVAMDKGLSGICFTDHFSVDPLDVSYGVLDYDAYRKEANACQTIYEGKLQIGCGLEISEPHLKKYVQDLQQALRGMRLDFIIGSVHNINSCKLRVFMVGKSKEEIYHAYFREVLKMVDMADIDVLGHLDLAKRYAFDVVGNYSFADYEDEISAILHCLVQRNIGLEINTSGWRNSVNESYPSVDVLKLYRSLGGKYITLASDAHRAEDVAAGFSYAVRTLRKIGFEEGCFYTARQVQTYKLH